MGIDVADASQEEMRGVFMGLSEEQQKEFSEKIQKAMDSNEPLQKLQKQLQDLFVKMQPLQPPSPVQGNVWVMLRSAPATTGTPR